MSDIVKVLLQSIVNHHRIFLEFGIFLEKILTMTRFSLNCNVIVTSLRVLSQTLLAAQLPLFFNPQRKC